MVRGRRRADVSLIVQKFGGTSVGSPERIKRVAERVVATRKAGHAVVVVVSAMSGDTNRLIELAKQITDHPAGREYDVLLASGEQVSIALLALAITAQGYPATSFLAHQVEILTDSTHGRARIQRITAPVMRGAVAAGTIAVVAGFQGMDVSGNITTLGRGGSDTTAVALAASMGADVCEIYTDVDGIYTADPRIVPEARKVPRVAYEEMLEMASLGTKVLQTRSVEFAMKYNVPVHVRSSFDTSEGSWVVSEEDHTMEEVVVRAVAYDRNEARISVIGVPDQPGVAAKVFKPLSEAEIVVDMIIQNASKSEGRTDLTFTVPKTDATEARVLMEQTCEQLGGLEVHTAEDIAKVSVVGVGMRSHSGVAARMFEVLSANAINIAMISTSEIKISVIIEERYLELAVRVLHEAFGLAEAD
jgi:aspartate kinase